MLLIVAIDPITIAPIIKLLEFYFMLPYLSHTFPICCYMLPFPFYPVVFANVNMKPLVELCKELCTLILLLDLCWTIVAGHRSPVTSNPPRVT